MNIYIQKVAIYYHHQNSEASYDYRSKKMKQKKSMKQQQKKMIPWSVNFFPFIVNIVILLAGRV